MNRRNGYQWLLTLSLLCCLPSFAATIYKSIDENGVVSFSDTRPADDILVETVVIDEQAAPPTGQEQQRLQDMRETTDRMVSDRMAREKHRAEMRQLEAQTEAQEAAQDLPEPDNSSMIYPGGYYGYYGYPARRPWRRPNHPRPEHPIISPMLPPIEERPPFIRPLPSNDYPGSLIRRYYDPTVREAYH
jgi:hypothetical protein